MRLIGHITTEPGARVFGDYLLVSGIENTVEEDPPGGWGIWVSDEDKLDAARGLLGEFKARPDDPRFHDKSTEASAVRAQKVQEQEHWEKRVKGRRTLFRQTLVYGIGPLTLVLIVVSVVAYVLMRVASGQEWLQWFLISTSGDMSLPEIRHGQIWRLVTPIFVHYTILHILFNMLWLKDLGSMIETRLGTVYLAFLVLALAVGSNLAQFYIGGIFNFGGMSGVVYGLLGYVWIRGRLDPASGFFLHPTTMIIMLVWFGAAFTGVLGNIANWAHAGGLVMGLGIGYMDAQRGQGLR